MTLSDKNSVSNQVFSMVQPQKSKNRIATYLSLGKICEFCIAVIALNLFAICDQIASSCSNQLVGLEIHFNCKVA